MKTIKEMTEVMAAFDEGKELEVAHCEGMVITLTSMDKGWNKAENPSWNWKEFDYRIKEEPLELWVNVYKTGETAYSDKDSALRNIRSACIKTIKMVEASE